MPDHMDHIKTDTDRIDWLAATPVQTKWDHRRGWVVAYGFPFGEVTGHTFRNAVDNAIEAIEAPKGHCHCATLPHRGDCPSISVGGYL